MIKKSARILHLADIHFRGLTRHDEYKESFTEFFEIARRLRPDLIYIGGDIVHSKTQGISPELIDILNWWFTGLAEIAPTHIILGNHDGLILNKHRQDAISPIITALNNDRLHLYKQSGTYPTGIPGINWCVFSCFDELGWESVLPVDNEVNIALFHGGVLGSKTDSDWSIEGEATVDFFDKFDFALLGDIHTCQFLNEDKTIAYCGSSIQQNYGESPGKGFLCWDIRGKDNFNVEFHQIPHYKPFVTIDWKGTVKKTISTANKIPDGSRFRVRSNTAIPQSDIIHLHSELKHIKNASEIVYKIDDDLDAGKIKVDRTGAFNEDLRDFNTHVSLFKSYYENASLSDEEWTKLEELIRLYLSQTSKSDDISRNTKWTIKNVSFDNTFAFGKNNQIDFNTLRGITGIFGPNRCGKSSIVGTIMYCLYNTTDRGPIKNLHIINTRKGHCKAAVDLMINGKNYRLERQSVKHENRRGQVNATTHLNFFQINENGEIIRDLTEEQRRETEKVVRRKIGTSEDFLMTSLASQGEMNTFIKERATSRKLILTKFLDLNVFEKMSQLAKDESAAIKAQMSNVPDREWDVIIFDLKNKTAEKRDEIKKYERDINQKRLHYHNLQLEIAKHTNDDVITPDDVIRQRETLENLVENVKETNKSIKKSKKKLDEIGDKIKKIEIFKSQFPIEELREKIQSQQSLEKFLIKIRSDYERELALLKNQERSIKKLEGIPCGDSFPTCRFIKDSHENKGLVSDQKESVLKLLDETGAAQRAIENLQKEKLGEKVRRYDDILKKESDQRILLSEEGLHQHNLQSRLTTLKSQTVDAKAGLRDMQARVTSENIDDNVQMIKNEMILLNSEINELDAQRISTAQTVGKLESDLKMTRQEKNKFLELKTKWKVYNLFLQAVSKKGIPLQIIMTQLPVINAEISKILQNTVGFTVELEADANSNAMDIYINYGDSRRVIELASGMEKMLSSLAIRVALINISSLPKTNMLVIDEGFGTLDEMNVEACNRLLESLKRWFKNILIISHVDAVKDVVDNVIDINRRGKDSHVKS